MANFVNSELFIVENLHLNLFERIFLIELLKDLGDGQIRFIFLFFFIF